MHKCSGIGKLKLEQDRLWTDHYWLTREVITKAVNNSNTLSDSLNELYLNQEKLGKNLTELTGIEKNLASELKEHIRLAVEIVVASIKKEDIATLLYRWRKNALVIAHIYARHGLGVRFEEMNDMMQEHLNTTLIEAVALISHKSGIEEGNEALKHIRDMASYLNSHVKCECSNCCKSCMCKA